MYSITALTYSSNTGIVPPGSGATGLNQNGDVAGSVEGEIGAQNEIGGAIWFYDTGAPYFTPPNIVAALNDINDSRTAAGILSNRAGLVFDNGATQDLSLIAGAQTAQEAYAINNSGFVCAGDDNGDNGLIIDTVNSTVRQLDFGPDYGSALPLTINDAGDFAGTCTFNGTFSPLHGFLCRGTAFHDLGANYRPAKLNNNGVLVGSYLGGPTRPAIWTWDATDPQSVPALQSLTLPQGYVDIMLFGVNDLYGTNDSNGGAIGYANGNVAMLFDGVKWTDLNTRISDASWVQLAEAVAINNRGQIAGTGYLGGGVETGFLLTPARPTLSRPELESLLQYVWVSWGVMVDGGGWTSGGPVDPYGPLSAAWKDALMGLAMDAAAGRVSDKFGREAIRTAALELTRRSVDSLIAQAKSPASVSIRKRQGDLRGRIRRKRFARSSGRQADPPKN